MPAVLSSLAVLLVALAGLALLVTRDGRHLLIALAAAYLGAFLLILGEAGWSAALIKLLVGWMAAAVLALSESGQPPLAAEPGWPSNRLFRGLTGALVLLVVFTAAPTVQAALRMVSPAAVTGGFVLAGLGLLHLGMTAQTLRVIAGLLTVLAGFEILYAGLEPSVLVLGLLASVNLGLALAGVYLLSAQGEPGA